MPLPRDSVVPFPHKSESVLPALEFALGCVTGIAQQDRGHSVPVLNPVFKQSRMFPGAPVPLPPADTRETWLCRRAGLQKGVREVEAELAPLRSPAVPPLEKKAQPTHKCLCDAVNLQLCEQLYVTEGL